MTLDSFSESIHFDFTPTLKCFIHNKLVVVEGEEDTMVCYLVSFRYVEVRRKIHETPFQAFEVVSVVMVPPTKETKNVEFPMVSWNNARIMIEAGHPEGWGRALELLVNKDHSSLGYRS